MTIWSGLLLGMRCRKAVNDMQGIRFKAALNREGKRKQQVWEGDISRIQLRQQPYEATMCIRGGSYHLIFGQQINGWFLCVPNWEIGVELSTPADRFWNIESLCRAGVSEVDAVCIADALKTLSSYIEL